MRDLKDASQRAGAELSVTPTPVDFDKYDLDETLAVIDKWMDEDRKVIGVGSGKWKRRFLEELTAELSAKVEHDFCEEHVIVLAKCVRDARDIPEGDKE